MGAMKSLYMDIEDALNMGMTFAEIAEEFNMEVEQVREIAVSMYEFEQADPYNHDHMERDHDEPYEPEPAEDRYLDSHYEDQYDLGDY